MADSDSDSDSPIYIVGYGTFIPNQTYLQSSEVKVCIVRNFRRIWRGDTIFPFILEDPTSPGFHALVFSISRSRVEKLDIYEGVDKGFFSRDEIEVEMLNGEKMKAHIYVPTAQTIAEQNLKLEDDLNDRWMEEIRKNGEIVKLFPELMQKCKK